MKFKKIFFKIQHKVIYKYYKQWISYIHFIYKKNHQKVIIHQYLLQIYQKNRLQLTFHTWLQFCYIDQQVDQFQQKKKKKKKKPISLKHGINISVNLS